MSDESLPPELATAHAMADAYRAAHGRMWGIDYDHSQAFAADWYAERGESVPDFLTRPYDPPPPPPPAWWQFLDLTWAVLTGRAHVAMLQFWLRMRWAKWRVRR